MDKEKYRRIKSVFITVRALYSQKMCKRENYESFKATLQPLYSDLKASAKENNNDVLIYHFKKQAIRLLSGPEALFQAAFCTFGKFA